MIRNTGYVLPIIYNPVALNLVHDHAELLRPSKLLRVLGKVSLADIFLFFLATHDPSTNNHAKYCLQSLLLSIHTPISMYWINIAYNL